MVYYVTYEIVNFVIALSCMGQFADSLTDMITYSHRPVIYIMSFEKKI